MGVANLDTIKVGLDIGLTVAGYFLISIGWAIGLLTEASYILNIYNKFSILNKVEKKVWNNKRIIKFRIKY